MLLLKKKIKERQSFSPPDVFLAWLWRKRGSYKCILPLIIKIKSGSGAEVSEIMRLPQASGKEAMGKEELEKLCRKGSLQCAQPNGTPNIHSGESPQHSRSREKSQRELLGHKSQPSLCDALRSICLTGKEILSYQKKK